VIARTSLPGGSFGKMALTASGSMSQARRREIAWRSSRLPG
jgi:hypothetical protein